MLSIHDIFFMFTTLSAEVHQTRKMLRQQLSKTFVMNMPLDYLMFCMKEMLLFIIKCIAIFMAK